MKRRELLRNVGIIGIHVTWGLNVFRTVSDSEQTVFDTLGKQNLIGSDEHIERQAEVDVRILADRIGGDDDRFYDVAFNCNGDRVVACAEEDRLIAAVDPDLIHANDNRTRVAVSRRAFLLLVWDVDAGRLVWEQREHAGPIQAVSFDPEATRVATGGVREYRPSNPEELQRFRKQVKAKENINNINREFEFLPHGGQIVVRDATDGQVLQIIDGPLQPVLAIGFGADILSLDLGFVVSLWDPAHGQLLKSLDELQGASQGSGVGQIIREHAISADATRVVAQDARISVHSPGGAFRDGSFLQVWDITAGQARNWEPGEYLGPLAFSPDAERFAAGTGPGHALGIWGFDRLDKRQTLRAESDLMATFVAFSPDGRRVVSGDENGVVRLWELESGKLTRTIAGPRGHVRAVAFPTGRIRVASGGLVNIAKPGVEPRYRALKVWEATID